MGGLSLFHWVIVGVVVLLLFGNRLPSVMRSLGRGMVEFKKGMQGIDDESDSQTTRRVEAPSEKPAAEKQNT